jgi:hypothetical protein
MELEHRKGDSARVPPLFSKKLIDWFLNLVLIHYFRCRRLQAAPASRPNPLAIPATRLLTQIVRIAA